LRVRQVIAAALPAAGEVDPQIRRSEHADFQVNGILGLARPLRANPRELALKVAAALPPDEVVAGCEVSGPGFINISVTDSALVRQVAARASDVRLGVPVGAEAGVTVVDYSQPNIAKEMHVGHLRSTIIGDALVRILEFVGHKVVRQNHVGDWGTQFGMLIQYLAEHADATSRPGDPGSLSRLNALYRAARERFDADAAFADRSRARVVALQAGDEDTVAMWREIVAESTTYFNAIYQQLGVLLTDADVVGESFYNPLLADVSAELEQSGVAVRSDGALCVFFDDVLGQDGNPTPLIVQKSDGGFGYAATDLAAIRHRVSTLGASEILYVVDSRQALHFRMVFDAARRAGWLPDDVTVRHVEFGSVLGPDGRPFKTRAGQTVRLSSLLNEAVERAAAVVAEASPQLSAAEQQQRAHEVGVGAVKYADLATSRSRDYVFDVDRMVAFNGNTGVYLQYAHARVNSVLRKAPVDAVPVPHPELRLEAAERRLALHLDEFGDTVAAAATSCEPHRIAGYLYGLAQAFSEFWEACPVLRAPSAAVRENRLLFCELTRDTLRTGMGLLGLPAPEQL
jgi:arginyl-tRNA synthetase